MQAPLDQEEISPIKTKDHFAKISLFCTLLSIALIAYLLLRPMRIRVGDESAWTFYVVYFLYAAILAGFITILISLGRKEERSTWKIIAIILNLLLLIFMIAIILFAANIGA